MTTTGYHTSSAGSSLETGQSGTTLGWVTHIIIIIITIIVVVVVIITVVVVVVDVVIIVTAIAINIFFHSGFQLSL